MINNNNSPNHDSVFTMHRSVTIMAPQRSNSLDYLNFEEKRQLIASSLSLSEILQCGPAAAAAHAAKEIAENAVIGEFFHSNHFQMKWLDLLAVMVFVGTAARYT